MSEILPDDVRPVLEQQRAVDHFQTGISLKIDAYAGTGKTTTLRLLAASKPGRALYLAFNRTIAANAQERFPEYVRCSTTHSMAFRGARKTLGYPEWKLTDSLTSNVILELFRLPQFVSFHCGIVLARRSYAAILQDSLRRFFQSRDITPSISHVPCYGILESLSPSQFNSFSCQVMEHLGYLWNAMLDRTQGLPLGHDGYLKLWALSKPDVEADYVMVDEAQDLNPVLLDVLSRWKCQIVYVGDPYQQIYEWRGAVNAMQQVQTRNRCLLSESFRFGTEIAAAATIVLRHLGAKEPLRGSQSIPSHIGAVHPQAILARSNAGVITNILRCLKQRVRCAVVGGTQELQRMLYDVQAVKQGLPARSPELLGFQNWQEIMKFSSLPEGEALRGLVNLVEEHGETRILQALSNCEPDERAAQIVCATAHRSKGREWNYTQLDSDFEAGFARADRLAPPEQKGTRAAEMRLLYVAMTRARLGISLPWTIAKRFGFRNTTNGLL